jgi:hypothetical protein
MTTQSVGQLILATLESDVASVAGSPIITLFTDWKAHAGNTLQQAADLLQFQAAAPGAGIALEIEVEQQLAQLVITKVQAYIASKAPGSTVPPAAP